MLDDDAVSRHVIVSALHNAHFKVEGAGDPLATLPLLSEKQYGLITLVLEMPGMDGFEFCRRWHIIDTISSPTECRQHFCGA